MATPPATSLRRLPAASSLLWPCVVLALCSITVTAASWQTLPTADELKFLHVGRYLATRWDWEPASATVHAPLSFYTHGVLLKPFTFSSELAHLRVARLLMLVYAWGLGLAVYAWARTAHGARAGVLALVLWAALPDTLAHSGLITTDVILACWVTWLGFALWRWSATGRWRWAVAGGGALGLALLSKYSAALWIPVVLLLGLGLAVRRRPPPAPTPVRWLCGVAVVLGLGYVLLCLGYGGRGMLDTWGEHRWASGRFAALHNHPALARFPLFAPLPWLQGIDYAGANAQLGHPGFLLGLKFLHAPWFYQPVCFLYKVPTPFLVLLALAIPATKRVGRVDWRGVACLLGPPVALVLYLMFWNRIAGGFRYVYPLLPPLCIALGRYAAPDARMLPKVRSGVRVCIALCVATALWQFPNYLAYVNLFSGGQDQAYRLFADSTLDWGQTPPPDVPGAVVNPGPVPIAGPILVNVNTYHDVFTRGAPHGWLHALPVRRVHAGVWLELDGARALERSPQVLAAMGRQDAKDVERLLTTLPPEDRHTGYAWLALQAVEQGDVDAAQQCLRLAQALELTAAYALDPDVAFGQCLDLGAAQPDDPVAQNNAGVAAYLAGNLTDAAARLRRATQLQPRMPAPYANLAVLEAARGNWGTAQEKHHTFQTVVATSAAKAFHPYRVYYGGERLMLGNVLELWPRCTGDQLEAEIAWRARPSTATGAARVRAYQNANRVVEAGLALLDLERLAPDDSGVARAREEWEAAVDRLRREGRVSA